MSESNNYSSYFDDDEEMKEEEVKTIPKNEGIDNQHISEKKKSKDKDTYKIPIPKKKKSPNDSFDKPEPPTIHKKLIKDVKDLKEISLDELNSYPYSNAKLKNNNNVEIYNNLGELYEHYNNDEEMEYEVLGLQDLKDLIGENINPEMLMESTSPEEDISALEQEYEKNPENYEVLYKLIYLYRQTKNKEKLKMMREHTLALYPLSDEMWKEWIADDLAEIPVDDFNKKYEFTFSHFTRALKDFYCIYFKIYFIDNKICKKLMKFLITLKKEAEIRNIKICDEKYSELKVEKIRNRFEEYLEIWGLDFNLSSSLWDLYLSFETSNLDKFKKEKDEHNINYTQNLIRSIYRRRLSFPHIEIDITWNEYKKWEKSEDEINKMEIKYKEVKLK